jgi:hypothetical protein
MNLSRLIFNTILGMGVSSFLTIPVNALESLPNYCQKGETLFVIAETKGFWINICGKDLDTPSTYVGVSKSNGQSIRLNLIDYEPNGRSFEANNGDVNYLLIHGTPKGSFLTVTQGDDKELVRESVENWYEQKIPGVFE